MDNITLNLDFVLFIQCEAFLLDGDYFVDIYQNNKCLVLAGFFLMGHFSFSFSSY